MESTACSFPLLNATNFSSWRDNMRFLLMDRACWSFIQGTETPPEQSAPRREILDYQHRKDRAFSTIYYSVEPQYRELISSVSDGKSAFELLVNTFEPKSRACVMRLLDEFFNLRYVQGQDTIVTFVAKIKKLQSRLKDAGHSLNAMYVGFQAIRSLPHEFQGIVQIIYRWSDEDFVLAKIEKELVAEENRLVQMTKDLHNVSLNENVFNVVHKQVKTKPVPNAFKSNTKKCYQNSKPNSVKSKFKGRNVGPCFKCKKLGHLQKDCPNNDVKFEGLNISVEDNKCFDFNSSLGENFEINLNETIVTQGNENCDKFNWVVDTAATTHFCNNRDLFTDFKKVEDKNMSLAIDGLERPIEGMGTVCFFVKINGCKHDIKLKGVMYSPKLRRNLISAATLEMNNCNFQCKNGILWFYTDEGEKIFFAKRKNNLYFLKPQYTKVNAFQEESECINIETCEHSRMNEISLWHSRFCHLNVNYLLQTRKVNGVRGLPKFKLKMVDCVSCKLAKFKRVSFKSIGRIRSKRPLELIHMDVCGPMPVKSMGGASYFLSITDDFSRMVTCFILKQKSEVFDKFIQFQTRAERELESKILNVRMDNGMEFCHNQFLDYFNKQGIKAERTNVYSPEQNGVSERFNLTAVDCVKAMLNDSNLEHEFWAEALLCFTYAKNRMCHKFKRKTPFELFFRRKPSVAHFKIFGSLAYVGTPKQLRKKLDLRVKQGIMMGYATSTRGYRIWFPKERKLIETSNVRIDETKKVKGGLLGNNVETNNYVPLKFKDNENLIDLNFEDDNDSPQDPNSCKLQDYSGVNWIREVVPRKDGSRNDIYYRIPDKPVKLRSFNDVEKYCNQNNIKFEKSNFNFCTKISDNVQAPEASNLEIIIPRNYKDIFSTPDLPKWQDAMSEEINVIQKREVWDLVPAPQNAKIIGSRWVYNVKKNENGEVSRYKARLVAQGNSQVKGESYDEVFSPVVNFSLIRMFFSIFVCMLKWSHCQLDIKCAYLYAKLNETVFMRQPPGFVDSDKPNYVCKLKRALYGLHQSGREWFNEIDHVLSELGFVKFNWCNCAYIFQTNVLLLLYVDDIVIFGKTQPDVDLIISMIESRFDIKVLGKIKKLLGIEFCEVNGKYFLHQRQYITKILEFYSEFKIPFSSLPIAKGVVLTKLDCPSNSTELEEMSNLPYRSILGCLAFIANRTRPDICYAVNVLSQFQENPGIRHWNILLKLLGYLKETNNYMLDLSKIKNLNLTCYTDSDFAANRDDRVSMSGMLIFTDEVPISWRTTKQKCVSLSTMEAEYVSMAEAAKELLWIGNVLKECEIFGLNISETKIFCDNQAAINFSNSPVENHRTKHIDVRFHFLRNLIFDKVFEIQYVNTKLNKADCFTKPLSKEAVHTFCNQIFQCKILERI